MVFTTRLAGGKGGRNALQAELPRLHVAQQNASPNHPTTCGKVERFQQTMKNWLRAQPNQPATITDLQALLDQFTVTSNHQRPHRSLSTAPPPQPPTTPSPKPSRPPAATTTPTPASATTASTLRRGHLGRGRPPPSPRRRTNHARTHLVMLVDDLQVGIVNAATGELLRELTIDPSRDYQPTGRPPGRQRKRP
jgi:hypothetical protein